MNADKKMVGFIGVHRWLNWFLRDWARAPLAYVRGSETQCADTVADAKLAHVKVRSSETLVAFRQDIIGHGWTRMYTDKKAPGFICVHLCSSVAEFCFCEAGHGQAKACPTSDDHHTMVGAFQFDGAVNLIDEVEAVFRQKRQDGVEALL
jgi:hypothetical protein